MRGALAILTAGVVASTLVLLPARGTRALARAEERRAGAHAPSKSVDYDLPTERWREGPVRYILTGEEDEAYRLLSTDEARAAFIQKFWASRDPVASTPDNEYRSRFYTRVSEANSLFTDSPVAGWKTDRGKIFILLGPPDDLEQEQTRGDLVPNVVIWTYRHPPGGENMNALPVVRFIRDATGEFRLSNDVFQPGFETSTGITYQIQAMQMKSLPQQKTLLDTIAGAQALSETGPFRAHDDFFRARDGNTLTILTLGVKTALLAGGDAVAAPQGPSDSRFEAVARFVGGPAGTSAYDFAGPYGLRGGAGGPVLDPSGYLMFQGALPIHPGTYTAYFGVVDHHDGRVYSSRESVVVPDLRARQFRLSRITLAGLLERVDGSPGAYTTPFVLGDLRVLPRGDDVFKNGEEFAFYYQIYGPDTDPIDGRPDLDVEYQFFIAERGAAGGLKFVTLGRPIRLTRQRSQVQGYSLPLRDWPPAIYRLRVQVKDNLTEERSTEEVSFRIL